MATSVKLAQSNPSAATATTLYTCPSATSFAGKVIVCNRSSTATSFRISIDPDGGGDSNEQYICYDVNIPGNETYESPNIVCDASDLVRVYATLATLSFSLVGMENS